MNLSLPENALSAIDTPAPIVIRVMLLPRKAVVSIVLTDAGRVISVSPLPWKTPAAIPVTVTPLMDCGISILEPEPVYVVMKLDLLSVPRP